MKTTVKGNYAEGSISRNIIGLALPIVVAELVNVLYNIVDRVYIGHIEGIGTASLTGIGICMPLISLLSAFAALSGMGGSPIFSIARGHGDEGRAKHILETDFTMLLINAAILMFVFVPTKAWCLNILGGDAETLPYAVDYFGIYIWGTPFVLITLGMNSFINAQGFPKIGMCTVIIGALLNIILDPVFIFVLGMNVQGAAIATVISQCISAAWVVRFLLFKAPINISKLRLDVSCAVSILKLGVTGFTFKITNSLTQAVINITLKAWGGEMATMYIAAMSIVSSLREVTWQPISGVVEGFKPVASYNFGARLYDRVRESIKFTLKVALAVGLVLWGLLMVFPAQIAGLFTDDEELIRICVPCIRSFFCFYFLMCFMSTSQSTFIALNMPKQAVFFSLNRKVLLIVPLTIFLPYFIGVSGVFWAESISEIIGATICFVAMYLTVWRHLGNWEEYQKEKQSKKKLHVRKEY